MFDDYKPYFVAEQYEAEKSKLRNLRLVCRLASLLRRVQREELRKHNPGDSWSDPDLLTDINAALAKANGSEG